MIEPAITISLTPEAKNGPFVLRGDLASACAVASDLGFKAVELFPPSKEHLKQRDLKQVLKRHGLKLAAVGTGAGWLVHKLTLTSPEKQIRKQAERFITGIIELAASFGAPAIIGSMQGRLENETQRPEALNRLSEALDHLGEFAAREGAPLLVEPLNRYETNVLNRISDSLTFLKSLNTKNIKLLCDLFHMNIEEPSISKTVRDAGKSVGHVHWADSNRRAMGFGHTRIAPVVKALRDIGYKGYVSAEVFPLPSPEAAARQTIKSYNRYFKNS